MTQFQEYLSSNYPGFASFIETIIKPIFGASFSPDDKIQDMIECPEDIDDIDLVESSPDDFKAMAAQCGVTRMLRLGRIRTSDGFPIHVYDITVTSRKHIARNRKGIQQIIRKSSDMNNQTGAFMLFHYEDQTWEWRFSYCFIGKNREDSTSGKRYTYLLGPGQSCKTAALRFQTLLKKGGKIAIEDITDAFSVESVSKEFFDEYRSNYADIVCYVTGKRMVKVGNKWEEKKEHEPNEFIMQQFTQFANPEKSVRDYIKKLMGRLVFLQFIQKKGWLGVPMNDEKWTDGDKEFIRHLFDNHVHQDTFIDDVLEPLFYDINTRREDDHANSILGADIKVPYLNGGLFEKDAEDDTLFPLPSKYMADLLEFFSAYNFTIDENDPDDAEVGIDPEMLGRVFENLLEDNKDKGAFYTPKEIVQYMCRESLIAYLQTDIEDSAIKNKIRKFVTSHEKSALDTSEEIRVKTKLREVKICDPAIGSGAFPMGMLKELFECRMAIEGEVDKTRADIKKDIIQNSIYGVDIEKGAVDIARLRFWLSLIIDEQTPHALPNMDFKIMQGNSLLEQYKGVRLDDIYSNSGQMELAFDEETAARMAFNEHIYKYYKLDDQNLKREQLKKIDSAVKQLVKAKTLNNPEVSEAINSLDFRNNSDFFLWHTWFNDVFANGGFDIVIGNPPFVQVKTKDKKIYKDYPTIEGHVDLYELFIQRGNMLLKKYGILSYIIPNTILSNLYSQQLRKLLINEYGLEEITNFGMNVFPDQVVHTCILRMQKNKKVKDIGVKRCVRTYLEVDSPFDYYIFKRDIESTKNYTFDITLNGIERALFQKINKHVLLGDICYMRQCIKTGNDKEYVIITDVKMPEPWKKTLRGKGMERYLIREDNIYLKYGDWLARNWANKDFYERPKIAIREAGKQITACLDDCNRYFLSSLYAIYPKKEYTLIDLKFLLGILNSSLATFCLTKIAFDLTEGAFTKMRTNQLARLPIPYKAKKEAVSEVVDRIMAAKQSNSNADTTYLEHELDLLVYDLYGLTPEEIAIVEGTNK